MPKGFSTINRRRRGMQKKGSPETRFWYVYLRGREKQSATANSSTVTTAVLKTRRQHVKPDSRPQTRAGRKLIGNDQETLSAYQSMLFVWRLVEVVARSRHDRFTATDDVCLPVSRRHWFWWLNNQLQARVLAEVTRKAMAIPQPACLGGDSRLVISVSPKSTEVGQQGSTNK